MTERAHEETFDLIVLGTGGMGSAALHSAASRGMTCLGLDRFPPAHDRGSSHGESRLIRLSYFEHPGYVPMLRRSYELWDALDSTLLQRSGVLYVGPEDGVMVSGVLASAREHGLRVERVAADASPQYRRPRDAVGLFEADAGWLPVETCVHRHLDAAVGAGALHRWGEPVTGWSAEDDGLRVVTDQHSYRARALVIAGGPWAGELLADLALPVRIEQKHMHWFRCEDDDYRHGFVYELPDGFFYGFPTADGRLKVGEHSGGQHIDDPLHASRNPSPDDDARVDAFVAQYLPGVRGERLDHATCFYTRTPDEHFILDTHPEHRSVSFVAGLSGHGYKFAPAIGEALVDLALGLPTAADIAFLSLQRFQPSQG